MPVAFRIRQPRLSLISEARVIINFIDRTYVGHITGYDENPFILNATRRIQSVNTIYFGSQDLTTIHILLGAC